MGDFSIWHWTLAFGSLLLIALPFAVIGLVVWIVYKLTRKPAPTVDPKKPEGGTDGR